ncbi:hypothetical protein DFP72DRAFT_335644 [Ephemerocybe angulata]|uniref:Uncharacterized protein n=1 Tax=Ephemerocybe angulata TaxID=980116 RepID=A0A8H6MHD9_9AGAR|nr:hypothetical protein DFP72DRAFT_335644 [Tulosesus angulatus]
MLKRRLLSAARPRLPPVARAIQRKPYSVEPKQPTKEEINTAGIQAEFANHAETAFRTGFNIFKIAAIGGVLAGLVAFGSWELSHQYVEKMALRAEDDEEVKKYQWNVSGELWQGDASAGGTDPGLGSTGRQAVRAAWMATHWNVNSQDVYATSVADAVDAPSRQAIYYLGIAIAAAGKVEASHLHPFTVAELHNRTAGFYERLGDTYLDASKGHFEEAWRGFSGEGLRAARVALRLGDLSFQQNQHEEAQRWWRTAVELCQDTPATPLGPLSEPESVPTSLWAQRIIASTLVSLSAFYAQTGKLSEAESFEESSLSFLRSIPSPDSITEATHPQALHALFLLQRSSILSIHLAEVFHAQKKPVLSSIQYLTLAANSSERVARALTGLPLHQGIGALHDAPVPGGEDQIIPAFKASNSMDPVARRLYHDAKRTSAEAWNLLGVLYEQHEGPSSKTALLCYERAVRWAGQAGGEGAVLGENEATTEADWSVFWSNFQRAKGASDEKRK